jgi:hypothetical protein
MPVMLVGFVEHLDAVRREGILQLPCDVILHEHGRVVRRAREPVNRQDTGARREVTPCEEIVKTFGNKNRRGPAV